MPPTDVLSRRTVLREFILGSFFSWLGGQWIRESALAVSGVPIRSTATLRLSLADFPAITTVGGSVRLEVGLEKPIIVNRGSIRFHAVSSRCQHLGCTVEPYDPGLGVMRCACHGSRYNIDGGLNAGPALIGLDVFAVFFDGTGQLAITLPGASFGARDIAIVSTSGVSRRLRLSLNATAFTSYQVLFRVSLTDTPQVVPFSTGTAASTRTTRSLW